MSIQAVSAVLDHSQAEKSARLVAISIANHVDKNGVGWLSVRLTMEESRIKSRQTVIDAMKHLREELGELVVLVPADGKVHRPPLYWLNLPGLSGDCGDDHPYFLAYGSRSELGVDPGLKIGPGPSSNSGPAPVQKLDPTPSKDQTHPGPISGAGLYREPSKSQKEENPDDKSSGALCALLADLVAANDPNGKRPTVTKAWLNAERLLLDRDEREFDVAERLIRWCQKDDFWRGNIRSMPKFRQQYGTLFLQASRQSIDRRRQNGSGAHPADERIRQLREGDGEVIDAEATEIAA
jgi:hypothetical protein